MNVLNFLLSAISLGTTFLYGSTGEILTEKVGHLNLGIPGVMCVGGASGAVALQLMYKSGLPSFLILIIALIATFIGGALMGLLYSFLTVSLHANQNVTGLALTTFGAGLMRYMMSGLKPIQYLYAVPYFRNDQFLEILWNHDVSRNCNCDCNLFLLNTYTYGTLPACSR